MTHADKKSKSMLPTRGFIFREPSGQVKLVFVKNDKAETITLADAEKRYTDLPFDQAEVVEMDHNEATDIVSYKPIRAIGGFGYDGRPIKEAYKALATMPIEALKKALAEAKKT